MFEVGGSNDERFHRSHHGLDFFTFCSHMGQLSGRFSHSCASTDVWRIDPEEGGA